MEHLTKETFKQKVFDYEDGKELKFKGDNPCIIDFYADWCAPCKMVTPILEELAQDYEGKLDIYKVNTEEQVFTSSQKMKNPRWPRAHYQKNHSLKLSRQS